MSQRVSAGSTIPKVEHHPASCARDLDSQLTAIGWYGEKSSSAWDHAIHFHVFVRPYRLEAPCLESMPSEQVPGALGRVENRGFLTPHGLERLERSGVEPWILRASRQPLHPTDPRAFSKATWTPQTYTKESPTTFSKGMWIPRDTELWAPEQPTDHDQSSLLAASAAAPQPNT